MLAEALSLDGHKVEIAANGLVALDKLAAGTYEVILSNVKMPELDGPGLYREVARRYPELVPRFIFLTGDTLSPQTRKFLEETNTATLGKPFDLEEIRRALQRIQ